MRKMIDAPLLLTEFEAQFVYDDAAAAGYWVVSLITDGAVQEMYMSSGGNIITVSIVRSAIACWNINSVTYSHTYVEEVVKSQRIDDAAWILRIIYERHTGKVH